MADNGGGRFRDVITTEAELRAIMGEASETSAQKVIHHIDDYCRRFIAAAPFVVVGTRAPSGMIDMSPKGDPAGFVQVLDDKTLAVPDRLGNRRFDSFRNILENPDIGLIFIIPGTRETLRVCGKAQIVRDIALRETMVVNGRVPDFALVVDVEQAFFHCSKCMIRSKLWAPETWPDRSALPSLAEIIKAHTQIAQTTEAIAERIETAYREQLY